MSLRSKATLVAPCPARSSVARAIIRSDTSTPVTAPVDPTAAAAANAATPVPVATSTTRSPVRRSARSTQARVSDVSSGTQPRS